MGAAGGRCHINFYFLTCLVNNLYVLLPTLEITDSRKSWVTYFAAELNFIFAFRNPQHDTRTEGLYPPSIPQERTGPFHRTVASLCTSSLASPEWTKTSVTRRRGWGIRAPRGMASHSRSRDSDRRQPPETSSATSLEGVAGEPAERAARTINAFISSGRRRGGGRWDPGRPARAASRGARRPGAAESLPAVPRTLRGRSHRPVASARLHMAGRGRSLLTSR